MSLFRNSQSVPPNIDKSAIEKVIREVAGQQIPPGGVPADRIAGSLTEMDVAVTVDGKTQWAPSSTLPAVVDLENNKVDRAGDTMTGNLIIDRNGAAARGELRIDVDGGQGAQVALYEDNVERWAYGKGAASDEWFLYSGVSGNTPMQVDAATDVVDFAATPTFPTATAGDNSTKGATTAYVETASGLLIPKSLGDAKGDLVGFSAADTPVRIAAAASNGSVLTSDTSQTGGVVWSSPAAVSLYNPDYGGSASITTITERLLDWNSEAYDHGGFHAANATNIVVPTGYAGVYNFAAIVKFTTCPAGAHEAYVRVRHYNASAVLQNDFADGNKSPAGMNVAAGTGVLTGDVYLADGDYLTVSVWHNSGGSLTMQTAASSSRFTMHRVADL